MRNIFVLVLVVRCILPGNGQNTVSGLKDRSGNLWFSVSDRGIYRFDGRSFSRFSKQLESGSVVVSCIYEDRTGNLWFKTSDGGVCRYDGKTFTGLRIPLPDSTVVGAEKYFALVRNPVVVEAMLQDKKGRFWFLTTNHGVYHYDKVKADSVGYEKAFTQVFVGVAPVCIAENRDGGILIGCWDGSGVHYYDGSRFIALNGFSDGMVGCITMDASGNAWMGTRISGVDLWDGIIQPGGRVRVTNFSDFSKRGDNSTNCNRCIFQDSKGNMWFGTNWNNHGVRGDAFRYDGKTFINITENERTSRFKNFSAMSFVEDNEGNIWIGSRSGILLRYDGKSLTDFSQQLYN